MSPSSLATSPRPPLSYRARSAWAQLVLAFRGVALTPRSARRLAAASIGTPSTATSLHHAAEQLRGRAALLVAPWNRWRRWREQRLLAGRDQLDAGIAYTRVEVERLETQFPNAAIPEVAGLALLGISGLALLAEGWMCYASLSQIVDDQPVPLLLSSVVAAPLAGTLLHRAGAIARRATWVGRIGWAESMLFALCVAAPLVLGAGIVMSRVGDATGAPRTVALIVGAGLQACLLLTPAVWGWNCADPVPGLASARRQLARLLDRRAVVVRKLEAAAQRSAVFDQARSARLAECLAALAYWMTVYHRVPTGTDADITAVSPWPCAPTQSLALASGGTRA